MKKTLCFMLSALLILAMCALPALAADPVPEFVISAGAILDDGEFTLSVSVKGSDFSGGIFAIQYDQTKVQLMDGDAPAVSSDTAAEKYFGATGCSLLGAVADVENGRVMTSFYATDGIDAQDAEVTLATLDFKTVDGVTSEDFDATTFSYVSDGAFLYEHDGETEPMRLVSKDATTVWSLFEEPKLTLSFNYPKHDTGTRPTPPVTTPEPPVETPTPEIPVFDDLDPSDWYYDNIIRLVTNGIISGDEGRATVRPLDNITRQEVAVVLVNALKLPLDTTGTLLPGDPSSDWAVEYLLAAKENGIIMGDNQGFMNGEGLARRSEVVTMVARAIGLNPEDADISVISGFADFDTIEDWAVPYAALMVQNGYLMGYEDNTLRLSNHILRCETFALVDRILFG